MRDAHDPAPLAGRHAGAHRNNERLARSNSLALLAVASQILCPCLGLVFAAALVGCGNVKSMSTPDAPAPAPPADASIDGPVNRCAPKQCMLVDEFDGADVDKSIWGVAVGGGATVTQKDGVLTLHLPQGPEAFADVYSLAAFAPGTTFMASVTFTPGQFYDHKGVGFASSRINSDCFSGETEAAMFRGQDGDGYIETKLNGTATCTLTTKNYPGGATLMKITRATDQVVFTQNNTALSPITTQVPGGHLPIRFSGYTYATAPIQPVQIDVDWVAVMSQ